jgi:hypothetical protein
MAARYAIHKRPSGKTDKSSAATGGMAAYLHSRSSLILPWAEMQTLAWTLTPDTLAQRGLETMSYSSKSTSSVTRKFRRPIRKPGHTHESHPMARLALLHNKRGFDAG